MIIKRLNARGEVKASEIVKVTGFSRAYINRFFRELRAEGRIVLLGRANRARYVSAEDKAVAEARKKIMRVHRILRNKDLAEDLVLTAIKKSTGIFLGVPENVSRIVDYAFTEMLNNAIEHSRSPVISVTMKRDREGVRFDVVDRGIGIFNHIMQKKQLQDEMEAIQDLTKGKLTTAPEAHSGEGIFFTSKAADALIIKSSRKKLTYNNLLQDIFIDDIKNIEGTRVVFSIGIDSKRQLDDIFKSATDASFEFSTTEVKVKLYSMGSEYVSRSQARRILSGLDKFKTVILDFQNVTSVGQGFADEIFRVWKGLHPEIVIIPQNTNENIRFMIDRASSSQSQK